MSTPTYLPLPLAFAVAFFAICVAWQMYCEAPPRWVKQLESLGQPRKQMLPGTAIICGGSISGIVTARICADHFERVIIIDPEIQDSDKPKTRIMQYHAVHTLLALFVIAARRLWPNFDAEVIAAGGRLRPADLQVHYSGLPRPAPYDEYPAGRLPQTLVMRRSSSQRLLERIFLEHPTSAKTTVLRGTVRSLSASDDGASIATVTFRQIDGTLVALDDAALVVDCTGGAAQSGLKWLPAAGFSVPATIRSEYQGNMQYFCMAFDVPPDLAAKLPIPASQKETGAPYIYAPHDEAVTTLVMLIITDNNTMQLAVGDTSSGEMPRAVSEVVPFIAGFPDLNRPIPSWVLETIELLCEHGNPSAHIIKLPTQSFVQYSLHAGALPSNFIAAGDASMQLNPIHGQGVTKAIYNGITLNALLHSVKPRSSRLPSDFSASYFKSSAPTLKTLWDTTRLHDYGSLRCRPMDGETLDTGRFVRWIEDTVFEDQIYRFDLHSPNKHEVNTRWDYLAAFENSVILIYTSD
ncbi:hypothetical protein C8R47DRAFT_1229627 [Mycena vitilis]|nr:hypothetical protein C8R47DRAFT_1229627 [Mycena vitilis]